MLLELNILDVAYCATPENRDVRERRPIDRLADSAMADETGKGAARNRYPRLATRATADQFVHGSFPDA